MFASLDSGDWRERVKGLEEVSYDMTRAFCAGNASSTFIETPPLKRSISRPTTTIVS